MSLNKAMGATRSRQNDCSNERTRCSIIGSPPTHAGLTTVRYEAVGTMYPRPHGRRRNRERMAETPSIMGFGG